MTELIETLKHHTYKPKRDRTGDFIFSVDHCFSIRGQGTVMTGTVLNGGVAINDVSFTVLNGGVAINDVSFRFTVGTIFSVDHCFSIRGQGTVVTGTVLNGGVAINDVSFRFTQGTIFSVDHC